MGDAFTSTYLPIAVGAVLAGVLSIAFILRSDAFAEARQAGSMPAAQQRQLALRIVLTFYAAVAAVCFVVAVLIGEAAFIALTGMIVLLAAIGLGRLWSMPC